MEYRAILLPSVSVIAQGINTLNKLTYSSRIMKKKGVNSLAGFMCVS